MNVPAEVAREISPELERARKAVETSKLLVQHGAGHPPERLEDALNQLEDAAYQARRAFGRNRARLMEANPQ